MMCSAHRSADAINHPMECLVTWRSEQALRFNALVAALNKRHALLSCRNSSNVGSSHSSSTAPIRWTLIAPSRSDCHETRSCELHSGERPAISMCIFIISARSKSWCSREISRKPVMTCSP